MVYKKIFAGTAIIVLVIAFLIAMLFMPFALSIGYISLPYTGHNKNFDKEQNEAMIHFVEQVIDVQYKTHSPETLKEIFTEEFLESEGNYLHDLFREGPVYFNKNYMKTMRLTKENQWSVVISMHEGGLMSGYSFFLHVTIIKTEDGAYLINSIGRDA